MSWIDIRKMARGIVHGTFAGPAKYFVPGDTTGKDVTVRFHTKDKQHQFGVIDREGFAREIEDINKMIFWVSEFDVLGIVPEYRGKVLLPDGREFMLELHIPQDDDVISVWEVV